MTETLTVSPVKKASRPIRDTSHDREWINEHIDEFRGQWVMVYECRLIGADPNIRGLLNRSPRNEYPEAIVTYVPTEEEAQRMVSTTS
jgi:hypothetical protein